MVTRKKIKHFSREDRDKYSLLPDYAAVLKKTNLVSTVELRCRMYICLDALKKGFKAGCRRDIGLDGCFLKVKYKGEILSAMTRDSNDQMFPLAWAVVVRENYDTLS